MKKAFFLAFVIPFLVSCEFNQQSTIQVVNVTVSQSDWHAHVENDGSNLYYYCTVNMPEITPYVYSSGLVNAYIVYNDGQVILPSVKHYEVLNPYMTWTNTINFDYSVGSLNIIVRSSDFVVDPPPAMNFRIVIQE